ncbi:porin [Paraburkholderia flava]|uniref:porin n=1 Tax=Paraburkholderia flava TaxID=2547393 RepID=UPI00105DA750|nr:porin [Paraburkholderia flava]
MNTAVSDVLRTTLKTIVVAGVLAGASSAFAQSSVQLYGQVDEWVGSQKFPGNKASAQVSGGGMSTSYWGLKGTEDLGNGYKAIFTLEDFFLAQNGQYGRFSGDSFFSRNAYVGIESPYGTVTAGRLTTHLFVSTILFNPFIDSYVFSPMVAHVYLGLGTFPTYTTDQGVTGDSGWNNAVQYSSPNFNGLSGSVMYGLGNTAGQNSAKKWSGQVLYFHGPFAATAVYQYVNFNNVPLDLGSFSTSGVPGLKSQSVAQFGASYDMKFVKFYGQYMYTFNDQQMSSWHVNTAQGGVSVPLGTGTVMASYAYSRDSGGLDQTRQTASIGYDYPLSKRTDVYAAYMYDHISSQSTGDTFGVGIRAKF